MKKSESKRVSTKSKSKFKKDESALFIPYTPSKAEPCYSREDIESILTSVMMTAVTLSALLLTLSIFITALKH